MFDAWVPVYEPNEPSLLVKDTESAEMRTPAQVFDTRKSLFAFSSLSRNLNQP